MEEKKSSEDELSAKLDTMSHEETKELCLKLYAGLQEAQQALASLNAEFKELSDFDPEAYKLELMDQVRKHMEEMRQRTISDLFSALHNKGSTH